MSKVIEFDGQKHEFPDDFTDADISAALGAIKPPSVASDVVKSIPDAVSSGLTNFAGAPGSAINWLTNKANAALGLTDKPVLPGSGPSRYADAGDFKKAAENVTGELYKPQTPVGKIAHAGVESLSNPLSYLGPGGVLLKTTGAALSGAGSEAGGQALEGTGYEGVGKIVGALGGGMAAAKAFGPTAVKAAIPTAQELKTAGVSGGKYGGYEGAGRSGLELDPKGVAASAAQFEQKLYADRFSGGKNGTAPKTFGALEELQTPPTVTGGRAFIGPANIDAVRAKLQDIASEVQATTGGAMVATKDAAAASKALGYLNAYTENIPRSHILAGDAAAYVRATKEANANYGAFSRTRDFDARLTKAERATDRQIAGSLDAQIKTKAGQLADRGARGLNEAEQAQLSLIERGSLGSNILRQLGRGGAGVIPMGTHMAAAALTGGGSIPASLALGIPLYAARKGSEAITKSRANRLVEMLAKRSPEYESRVNALPQVSNAPNKAAIIRALLGAH